jgi:propanol-preferring alcohol dehydrogenase
MAVKVMRLEKPGPVRLEPLRLAEVNVPEPAPGQILLRVHACGVCHTDLHTVEGELPDLALPIVPGHEVVATVEARAGTKTDVKVGDRVGVAWLHRTCGACEYCRRGQENLCLDARFTGYHVNGGYAEYLTADPAFVYPLPRGLSDPSLAPLLCAGIIGYRALRLCEIKPGGRLGLYGFGASAHIAIQIAVHWNCRVHVFSRSEAHRQLARRLGAVWAGQLSDTVPEPLDAGVIFAPAGFIVPQALAHLDRGATLALAGIYMSEIPPLDYEKHLYYERTIRSVTASTRQDGHELIRLAAEIPIQTTVQTYRLEDANRALHDLKTGRVNGAAVLTLEGEGS